MTYNDKKEFYFVYGSLKQGYGNHRILSESPTARLVKNIKTDPIYTMYGLGGFPGVVEDGITSIEGEIWEVSDETTKRRLDALEGYYGDNSDFNLYNKKLIHLDGKDVFIYLFNRNLDNSRYKIVENGKW